jgi:hypothetical protein
MRDMGRGMLRKEVKLNGRDSEKKKNGTGHPRTHSGPLGYEKKNPKPE